MSQSLIERLDSFIAIKQKLEAELNEEKAKTQKLWDELHRANTKYRHVVQEANSRIQTLAAGQKKAAGEATTSGTQLRKVLNDYQVAAAELKKFKDSWSVILKREQDAKKILADYNAKKQALAELEEKAAALERKFAEERKTREGLERQARFYQGEVQGALVKLQSSEARVNAVSRNVDALSAGKKQLDEELARLEVTREDYSRSRSQLETEIGRLSQALEIAQRESAQAKNEADSMRKGFESKLLRAEGESRVLEGKVTVLAAQLEKLNEESRRMRAGLEHAGKVDQENIALRTELARKIEELKNERVRSAELEKILAREKAANQNAESTSTALKTRLHEALQAGGAVEALQRELQTAKSAVQVLETKLGQSGASAAEQMGRVREEMRTEKKRAEALEKVLASEREAYRKLENEYRIARARLTQGTGASAVAASASAARGGGATSGSALTAMASAIAQGHPVTAGAAVTPTGPASGGIGLPESLTHGQAATLAALATGAKPLTTTADASPKPSLRKSLFSPAALVNSVLGGGGSSSTAGASGDATGSRSQQPPATAKVLPPRPSIFK